MSAIAQCWQEFREQCYRGMILAPDKEREYRMLFYAGFNACQHHFGDMSRSEMTAEQMRIEVAACFEEWDRFAKDYLKERQREQ